MNKELKQQQVVKLVLHVTLFYLACPLFAKNVEAQEPAVNAEVQKMLDEYTSNIEIDRKMIAKGWHDDSSLALEFLNRGKVYWAFAKKYELAEQDFTTAMRYFQTPRDEDNWLYKLRKFEAWHYRAMCRIELGDYKGAEADACYAVKGFAKLVEDGHDHCASTQVYALKIRAKIRSREDAPVESLEFALADYELACSLSRSLAETEPELRTFFEEQIGKFRKQQSEVAERLQRFSKAADDSSASQKNDSR